MAKEVVVYQANPLIEGRREFSLIEIRLFYLGLKDLLPRLTEKDVPWRGNRYKEFPTTIVKPSELIELFGSDSYYSTLEDICYKLAEKTIKIRDTDKKGFTVYPVFAELSYKPTEGLRLEFNPKMTPWLLDLAKKPFTKIPFDQVWQLGSPYSVRLLELLLQYQNTKTHERTLTVKEIRACLNVPEKAYEGRMNNFRQFIIENPVKDINAKTAYKVEYEPVKEGRRIVAFKFKLHLPLEVKKAKRKERLEAIAKMPDILPSMPKEGAANTTSNHETNHENAKGQAVKRRREMPDELKPGFAQLKDILAN